MPAPMVAEPRRLDYWRKYFRSANAGIFDVIENAILVAASDCPKEFLAQRDRVAETLFSCQLARCHGCDKVKRQFSPEEEDEDDLEEPGREGDDVAVGVEKESKYSTGDDGEEEGVNRMVSNYSYDEAEALTEEIEEESQMVGEVLRIKEILTNKEDELDSLLFESLRRLQLMCISVETLKATEIGKAVNGLRKHSSKQIRQLVRMLIDGWKVLVDEWVNATSALTENTPESLNPSVVDYEEGLPSPPMDEGALFATTTMELSQFFDGMDDDGNLRNSDEFDKSRGNGRKTPTEGHNNSMRIQQVPYQLTTPEDKGQMRKQEALNRQAKPGVINKQTKAQELFSKQSKPQEDLSKQTRHQECLNRQNKQSSSAAAAAGPGRPQKTGVENMATSDTVLRQRQEHTGIQKMPSTVLQDKSKNSEDNSDRAKLEAAKRKLQAGYQQAENAKKQRTIQVMELQDIPKQGLSHRQPFLKQGNHNKFRSNGRR